MDDIDIMESMGYANAESIPMERPELGLDREAVILRLRNIAMASYASRVSLAQTDAEHHAIFVRAITNVLSTRLSLETYAQIIDGLPIADVAWDRRSPGIFGNHPIDDHEELCPGAMEKACELRD